MTDMQLNESLGEEFYQALRVARDHFYKYLPPFAARQPELHELCWSWTVLDHLLDRLIEVRIELENSQSNQ